jgi:hypothetical protein
MSDRADWDDDEPLGYKRPPRWGQFQKGKSGNPRGRPKGTGKTKRTTAGESELDAMQRKVLDKKVRVNAGGKTEQIKMQEVILHAQASLAAKGNPLAARDVIKQAAELEKREAARKAMQAEDMVALKQAQRKAWDLAKAEGRSEPDYPWPHPDDILLDEYRQAYRIQGPCSDKDVAHFEWIRAERDVAFMRIVIMIRKGTKAADPMLRLSSFAFSHYDALLPKRWKIADEFEFLAALHLELRPRQLATILARDQRKAETWKVISGNHKACPEGYRVANTVLAPVLKKQGYRSLAQFERAYEDTRGNPPWPRRTRG